MSEKIQSKFGKLVENSALLLSLILMLGFIFNSSFIDLAGMKEGSASITSSGRLLRIITVMIAGIGALFVIMWRSRGLGALFSGSLVFLTTYSLLAIATVVFSQLKTMTLFKGGELLIACLIAAILISSTKSDRDATVYLKAIFWIYTVSVASALGELMIFGAAGHKQLVGETPFLSTMMHSSYPPLVGNGLGYLGALVGLFGLYLYDAKDIAGKNMKIIGFLIFVAGVAVIFLSYTRSILVFFIFCLLVYSGLQHKFGRIALVLLLLMGALATPGIQAKIIEHMKRGATEQQLTTLSGRTKFWAAISSRDPLQLMVGEGFATGILFHGSEIAGGGGRQILKRINAHNSVAEIAMSSGIVGALLWLMLIIGVLRQLVIIRRRLRREAAWESLQFHDFIIAVCLLSILRCQMNSTFVYVDYFFFVLIALIAYVDSHRVSPLKSAEGQQQAAASLQTRILSKRKSGAQFPRASR